MSRRGDLDSAGEPLLEDKLIVAKEFARHLRISIRTFYRWMRAGQLPPPVKLTPRMPRWRLSTVRAFLASRESDPTLPGPPRRSIMEAGGLAQAARKTRSGGGAGGG
jgi:predicted DNA-binding transcriptional regulator AlpA